MVGDSGSSTLTQLQGASCLATAAVDLVLDTGDSRHPAFSAALADLRCRSAYAPRMRRVVWYPTIGNPEPYGPERLASYRDTWPLPANNTTGTAHSFPSTLATCISRRCACRP